MSIVDQPSSKYARIERERRFLLHRFPYDATPLQIGHITDRYIENTRLRLRRQTDDRGSAVFKLTQKIPSAGSGARQGFITTIYLNEDEFRIFANVPAKQLKKTRYSVPPFGIDVFEDSLAGLVLAEAEFDSDAEAAALIVPSSFVREVSTDSRFTGARLAHSRREELQGWLAEYGIES